MGRVTDSSDAVVVGVAVSATSETTGVVTPAKSNEQGNYEIRFLPPGQYKVSASMQGFKTWIQKNIELRVNDRIGLDIVLALGDVSENIVVSGETPLLQTATANTGQVIDNRRIADFPLMYGNATMLLFLAPGVNTGYPGGLSKQVASGQTAATTMVSFHGAPFGTTDFMLDGATNTQTTNADVGMAISINPPTDIVQEFKVEVAYDASVGHTSGTVVNHVTKSGTNGLHGTGYLFYRDPALNANSFFGNRSNQAKANLTFRRWGLSSGGPIVLP
ncbi:MAG: carboxypeptidase-like regulatory domain-containing protein, partial [Bryobacteraceae bacterium]